MVTSNISNRNGSKKEQDYKARLNRAKAGSARMTRRNGTAPQPLKPGGMSVMIGDEVVDPLDPGKHARERARREKAIARTSGDEGVMRAREEEARMMKMKNAQASLAFARRRGAFGEEEDEQNDFQQATDMIKDKVKELIKKAIKKIVKQIVKQVAKKVLVTILGSSVGLFIIGLIVIFIVAICVYYLSDMFFAQLFNPESIEGSCPNGICAAY